jgi:hypothetical protein
LAARWEKSGLTEAELVRRLFERAYPPPGQAAGEEGGDHSTGKEAKTKPSPDGPIGNLHPSLFAEERVRLCQKLAGVQDPKTIESFLRAEADPDIQVLVAHCKGDAECLKALKKILCPERPR